MVFIVERKEINSSIVVLLLILDIEKVPGIEVLGIGSPAFLGVDF